MNPALEVKIGVSTKKRDNTVRFRPTISSTETWVKNTNLEDYRTDIESLISTVWNFALLQRTEDITAECTVHYALTLENLTAAPPPKGALVQPKEHFDGSLADGDFDSVDALRTRLLTAINNIDLKAKALDRR